MKPWNEMTPRERDGIIAEKVLSYRPCGCDNSECDLWGPPEHLDDGGSYKPYPAFTTDLAACRLVEDEIERRGLQERYISKLDKLIVYERDSGWEWFRWGILRATPEERCHAALQAIGVL